MITSDELSHFGHFGKPHGIDGEINLYTDYEPEEIDIAAFLRLIAEIDGIFVPFIIEEIRLKKPGNYIVRLNDVESEKQSREFTNLDVYTLISDNVVPAESENDGLYAADLIGYSIVSASDGGAVVGKIIDVDLSTENALFIVGKPGVSAPLLIPVADELIEYINTDTLTIVMHLPDGLLTIN